jgi:hypothetical protein
MATVPVYGGPQIQRQALNIPQQREIDVSSGLMAIGRGLGDLGQGLERKQLRDAETEANRVDNEVTAGWLEWNAQASNAPEYQGQNADAYAEAAKKWWSDAQTKYGGSVTNPLARQSIGPALGRKQNQAMAGVLSHVGQVKQRHATQAYDAAQSTTVDFAVDSGNPEGFIQEVEQAAAKFGAAWRWTTQQVQDEQQKRLASMHLAHINNIVERDAEGARDYYVKNKKQIPHQFEAQAKKVIDAEVNNQFAMQFAAQQAGKPFEDQLQAAGEITDPERRKKTIDQVKLNQALVDAAQREREAKASDDAWQLASQGRKIPERTLAQMNGKERAQLGDWQREKVKQIATGIPPKTDWGVYIDLREKLAAGDTVDLRPYAGTKLAPAQLEQLLDIQTSVKKGKTIEVATDEQQVASYTKTLKLKGEKLGQFQSVASDRFNMFLERTGKLPTYDERQKILDQMTKDVVTDKGMIWDTTAPVYQAPKDVRDKQAPLQIGPVKVRTRAEALALKPGTLFIDPNGVERTR